MSYKRLAANGLVLILFSIPPLAAQSAVHETLWGKSVLKKRREQTRHLGGDFEFRSVAYYIDCSGGCFENPWHIGEFWYRDRMLTRGIAERDVSVSPSKRFAIFRDREARNLKLFDTRRAETTEPIQDLDGEVQKFSWDEPKHGLRVEFFGNHLPREIDLPD